VIPFAHVAGMPLEELLPIVAGPGTGLLAVRAWVAMSMRRRGEDGR
jgi:hypothetical protein